MRDVMVEALREVGHLFPDAHVLVCSGHVREHELREQVETRDVRYLGKPFTGRALVEAVAEALEAERPDGAVTTAAAT